MSTSFRDTMAASKTKRSIRKMQHGAIKAEGELQEVNPRVWNMFREALAFKQGTLAPFQRELANVEIATLDLFETTLPLLRAPLPRVWDTVEGGLAEPIRATVTHNHPHIAGGDVNENALRASVSDFEARLQLKVRRPLAQWSDALENVRVRMTELDRLKARLEKRVAKSQLQQTKAEHEHRTRLGVQRGTRGLTVRHKQGGLKGVLLRCTQPRADEGVSMASPGVGMAEPGVMVGPEGELEQGVPGIYGAGAEVNDVEVEREFKREERTMKIKDQQRKLAAASESFRVEEGLLYEQLSGLCRDAAWTKSYVASSLLMGKELFQEGVFNLGHTLQPLPAVRTLPMGAMSGRGAGAPAGDEMPLVVEGVEIPPVAPAGQMGSNMAYNAGMPDFASRARARATLEDLKAAASRRLHAHKATAQPLELHAHPEARAGDRVMPARRGLTDRPLSSLPGSVPSSPRGTPMMMGGGSMPTTPTGMKAGGGVVAPLTPSARMM